MSRPPGAPTTRRCAPIRPSRPAAGCWSRPVDSSSSTATPAPPSPRSPPTPACLPKRSTSPSAASAACSKGVMDITGPHETAADDDAWWHMVARLPTASERLARMVEYSCRILARTRPIHAIIRGAADKEAFAAELGQRLLEERLTNQTERIRGYLADDLAPGLSIAEAGRAVLRTGQPRPLPRPHHAAALERRTPPAVAHRPAARRPARSAWPTSEPTTTATTLPLTNSHTAWYGTTDPAHGPQPRTLTSRPSHRRSESLAGITTSASSPINARLDERQGVREVPTRRGRVVATRCPTEFRVPYHGVDPTG